MTSLTDINICSAEQLTAIPGIDKGTAESVVRFRRGYGRFTYLDELWKVAGMSRSKYQILKRHFRVEDECPKMIGKHLPLARLSLADSMLEFICKGQAFENGVVNSSRLIKSANTKQNSSIGNANTAVRILTNLNRHHSDKFNVPGSTLNISGVKDRVLAENRTKIKRLSPGLTEHTVSTPRVGDIVTKEKEDCKQGEQRYHKEENFNRYGMCPQLNDIIPPCLCDVEPWPAESAQPPPVPVPSVNGEETKPSFTLQRSASGNNINFSCTIDKRLLSNLESPLNLEFSGGLSQSRQDTTNREETQKKGIPKVNAFVNQNGFYQSNMNLTDIPENVCIKDTLLHLNDKSRRVKSLSATPHTQICQTTVSPGSLPLTLENLLVFDSHVRMTPADKHTIIDAWVEDVNEARQIHPPPKESEKLIKEPSPGRRTFRIANSVTVSSAHLHARCMERLQMHHIPAELETSTQRKAAVKITPFGNLCTARNNSDQMKHQARHKPLQPRPISPNKKSKTHQEVNKQILTAMLKESKPEKEIQKVEKGKVKKTVEMVRKTVEKPEIKIMSRSQDRGLNEDVAIKGSLIHQVNKSSPSITGTKKVLPIAKPVQDVNEKSDERNYVLKSFREKFSARPRLASGDILNRKSIPCSLATGKTVKLQSQKKIGMHGFRGAKPKTEYRNQFVLEQNKSREKCKYRHPLLRKPRYADNITAGPAAFPIRKTSAAKYIVKRDKITDK